MLMLMIILVLIAPFLVVLFPVLVPFVVVVPALAHVVLVLVRVSPGKTNSDISI